jgi:flagellar biosynthesis/type III secretory pathway chaperone|tara:strand:- start:2881 stop:3015 length:135 start_codon:yes stop_codon:yes gene_type:complete
MIGEVTEYKTVVTQKLIDNIQQRVDELKAKGITNDTARRCVNQD